MPTNVRESHLSPDIKILMHTHAHVAAHSWLWKIKTCYFTDRCRLWWRVRHSRQSEERSLLCCCLS